MSRAGVVAGLMLFAHVQIGAQNTRSLEGARRAVADAYARVLEAEAAARLDSVRGVALPVGRRYGGMVVHLDTSSIPPDFLRALDDAYAAAQKQALEVLGSRAHGVMTGMNLTIARGLSGQPNTERFSSNYVTLRLDPAFGRGFSYHTADAVTPNGDLLFGLFTQWFEIAAFEGMPATVRAWVGRTFQLHSTGNLYETYREIARTNATSRRTCMEGMLRACASLMAIASDTIGGWLTPDERRELVRQFSSMRYHNYRSYYRSAEYKVLLRRCTSEADDDACREVIRDLRRETPIGRDSRASLLRLAVIRGGADGYARLESARTGEIDMALAATAGVSFDSLMNEWRGEVMASKPESPAPNTRELLVSLALCVTAFTISAARRP